MLEAQNLTFAYEGQNPVLQSTSFRLEHGEIILMTGATGSGKSTFAKCLAGFIPRLITGTFSGAVLLDDHDTADMPLPELSRQVALVQQDTDSQICTLRVSDEVAFGPENYCFDPAEISKMISSSLNAMKCSHLMNRSTVHLSGGERQRIVISAMLACRPEYLILDEPSSSLDPLGAQHLRETLLELKKQGLGILCFEHQLSSILPIADRVLQLREGRITDWHREQSIPEIPRPPSSSTEPLLTASGLSFSYDDTLAVHNVTLTVHRGDMIALMGSNGSGKTTLLGLLGGLLEPHTGSVILDADNIKTQFQRDIARKIAVVFQNPTHQIFERTVWREQTLSCHILGLDEGPFLTKSEQLLERACLNDLRDRNPFSLSHGQKRRLNVTSVVAHEPVVYLFDEPFIGQDREGREFISDLLHHRAMTGGACVVVTHDPSFARNYCNRLVFMDQGEMMLDGAPEMVLERLRLLGRTEYETSEVETH